MLVIAVPLSLLASRLFAAVFDLPFQRHKTWSALLAAARVRLVRRRRRRYPHGVVSVEQDGSARYPNLGDAGWLVRGHFAMVEPPIPRSALGPHVPPTCVILPASVTPP